MSCTARCPVVVQCLSLVCCRGSPDGVECTADLPRLYLDKSKKIDVSRKNRIVNLTLILTDPNLFPRDFWDFF